MKEREVYAKELLTETGIRKKRFMAISGTYVKQGESISLLFLHNAGNVF